MPDLRLRSALRPALEGSRPWAWLAAVVAAATAAAYLTAAAGPSASGPGWDPVTGWGSPNAQVLVPLLAHYARS